MELAESSTSQHNNTAAVYSQLTPVLGYIQGGSDGAGLWNGGRLDRVGRRST